MAPLFPIPETIATAHDVGTHEPGSISASPSAYKNGLGGNPKAIESQSNRNHQADPRTRTGTNQAEPSLSRTNASRQIDEEQSSIPRMRSPPMQPASLAAPSVLSAEAQPAPQPAEQSASQLPRKRMLLARTPSSTADLPPPRAKRIQVTKKQAAYTTFSHVVDHVFSTALKNEYKYDALTEADEIRLMVINPARTLSDPLYCQLLSAINEETPACPYEALSYMWGDEQATKPIFMFYPELRGVLAKEGMKKKRSFQMKRLWARFYVRPNLYAALQRLRDYDGRHVYLWVDAICIDQSNNRERSSQVSKMDEVYNRARSVSVWLGSGNMQSELAFDFMKNLLEGTNLDRFIKDTSSKAHWIALAALMKDQWFSRRYVLLVRVMRHI